MKEGLIFTGCFVTPLTRDIFIVVIVVNVRNLIKHIIIIISSSLVLVTATDAVTVNRHHCSVDVLPNMPVPDLYLKV